MKQVSKTPISKPQSQWTQEDWNQYYIYVSQGVAPQPAPRTLATPPSPKQPSQACEQLVLAFQYQKPFTYAFCPLFCYILDMIL